MHDYERQHAAGGGVRLAHGREKAVGPKAQWFAQRRRTPGISGSAWNTRRDRKTLSGPTGQASPLGRGCKVSLVSVPDTMLEMVRR